MTTASVSAAEQMSTPAVDKVSRPLTRPEPTIGDVRRLLRLLAKPVTVREFIDTLAGGEGSDDRRVGRAIGSVQALCWQAEFLLARLSETVQDAPVEALNDLVADAKTFCKGRTCDEWVMPWADDPEFCSAECRTTAGGE